MRGMWDEADRLAKLGREARSAQATIHRQERITRGRQDPSIIPHGTRGGYTNWGCRCDECREVHNAACRAYARKQAAKRRA